MADYKKLIDAETWAFIERTNSFYPPETVGFTIERQRQVYDRMCAAFHAGYPEGIRAHDETLAGRGGPIPVRIYDRGGIGEPEATVVYYHGGGFVVGGLESHDDVCAEICAATGFRVASVDYRLCPEHLHPAAFDDAMSAFEWAVERFADPVLVAGDSAGGNLAAAVSHAARATAGKPAGQMLIYPGLGGDRTRGSYVEHAEAPMLTVRDLAFYDEVRSGGESTEGDPTYAPLADHDFSGLPPTVIVAAQCDPLCDDGADYRDAILAAGGNAVSFEAEGLVHGFLRARHSGRRARETFQCIAGAIAALGKGEWPY